MNTMPDQGDDGEMTDSIDLGVNPGEGAEPMPGDPMGGMGGKPDAPPMPRIYPELSVSDHPNPKLLKLPKTGHALVKYSVSHQGTDVRQHGRHKGKTMHSLRLKIHSIKPHKMPKKSKAKRLSSADDEAAVDAGL